MYFMQEIRVQDLNGRTIDWAKLFEETDGFLVKQSIKGNHCQNLH